MHNRCGILEDNCHNSSTIVGRQLNHTEIKDGVGGDAEHVVAGLILWVTQNQLFHLRLFSDFLAPRTFGNTEGNLLFCFLGVSGEFQQLQFHYETINMRTGFVRCRTRLKDEHGSHLRLAIEVVSFGRHKTPE